MTETRYRTDREPENVVYRFAGMIMAALVGMTSPGVAQDEWTPVDYSVSFRISDESAGCIEIGEVFVQPTRTMNPGIRVQFHEDSSADRARPRLFVNDVELSDSSPLLSDCRMADGSYRFHLRFAGPSSNTTIVTIADVADHDVLITARLGTAVPRHGRPHHRHTDDFGRDEAETALRLIEIADLAREYPMEEALDATEAWLRHRLTALEDKITPLANELQATEWLAEFESTRKKRAEKLHRDAARMIARLTAVPAPAPALTTKLQAITARQTALQKVISDAAGKLTVHETDIKRLESLLAPLTRQRDTTISRLNGIEPLRHGLRRLATQDTDSLRDASVRELRR